LRFCLADEIHGIKGFTVSRSNSHLHVTKPFYTGLWTPCLSGTSDHWSVPYAT